MTALSVEIRFGALSRSIAVQACEQGFFLPEEISLRLQAFADCATMLHVNGLMTDREVEKARGRLKKRIAAAIKTYSPKPVEATP